MHIKQITISNFRSFKQQPEIQPFSPGTNSVVGRNGSGKSNLFDAVQFVLLAPRFYTLRTVRTKPTQIFWRQISIRFRLCYSSSSKECS
jgi:chromosome segregation ATPase